MRHTDDVRAIDCDENKRWIELLVHAEASPPQAEVWRVAPALPEVCCQHAMGRLNQLLVGLWIKRGEHNAIRRQWRFRHSAQIELLPQHLVLTHQVWAACTARQGALKETSGKSLKIAV